MYENLFLQQQSLNRWNNNLQRMNRISKYIDYYNNDYSNYITSKIRSIYVKNGEKIAKFVNKIPITQRLIQDMSLVFSAGLNTSMNGSQQQISLFNQIINNSKLRQTMITVNRLMNLTFDVGVFPRYYNGRIILEILTPDKCWIKQVDDFPTQIEQLYYFANNNTDSNTAKQVNIVIKITKDTISKVEISTYGTLGKQFDIQPNLYGKIPVVWFHENMSYDNFWSAKLNPIIELHELYCTAKSFESYALAYQSYATLVTTGMPKDSVIDFGPQFWIDLPSTTLGMNQTYDAKYITPDADFNSLYTYSEQLLNQACTYVGLSADSFRRTAQFSSGFQLQLAKNDLIKYNEMQIPMFESGLKQLIDLMITTFNMFDDQYTLSSNAFTVQIPKLQVLESPAQYQSRIDWQLSKNIINIYDVMMYKYHNYTLDDIKQKYEQNTATQPQQIIQQEEQPK